MKKKTIAVGTILPVFYLLPAFYYLHVQQTNFTAGISKKVIQPINTNPGSKTTAPDKNTTGIYAVAITRRPTMPMAKTFGGYFHHFYSKTIFKKILLTLFS